MEAAKDFKGLEIQNFRTDGFLFPKRFVTRSKQLEYLRAFNEFEKRGLDLNGRGWHLDLPFVSELASNEELLSFLEELANSDVLVFSARFFCKYPGDGVEVYWHQDAPFWGFNPPDALVVWYAIDDSNEENGCLRIIPGTQNLTYFSDAQLQNDSELKLTPSPKELASAISVTLKSGECSIHHSNIIHGSEKNLSTKRRCGITLRYIPSYAVQTRVSARGNYFSPINPRSLRT